MPPKIIFIVGPTAIGKSDVAVRVAEKIGGEIVSCDSMQVYKEAAIVTNKPSRPQQKKIKHHLVGNVSVKEHFDVAEFNACARKAIIGIHRKNKIPIVAGGSGLYVNILLDGIFEDGPRQETLRAQLEQELQLHGPEFLYAQLRKVDPTAAQRIHLNDSRRIVRALEVHAHKGQAISELQKDRQGLWGRFDIDVIGLTMARAELYARINTRVDEMFAQGAVAEIEKLRKLPLSRTAGQIIGLKEIGGYLSGEYDLERAIYLMKRNTRHFAKRQMTWFRRDKRIQWVEVGSSDKIDTIVNKIIRIIE